MSPQVVAPGAMPCISSKKLGNVDTKAHAEVYDTPRNNWLEICYWKQ